MSFYPQTSYPAQMFDFAGYNVGLVKGKSHVKFSSAVTCAWTLSPRLAT